MNIQDLHAQAQAKRVEIQGYVKQFEELAAKGEAPSKELTQSLADANKAFNDITANLKAAEESRSIYRTAKEALEIYQVGSKPIVDAEQSATKGERPKQTLSARDIARKMLADPHYKHWVSEGARGQSPTVKFDAEEMPHLKALITGASNTSAGALVANEFLGYIDGGAVKKQLNLRSFIDITTTTSDVVEYAVFDTLTNNAGMVAEATTTGDSDAIKPESAMTWAVRSAIVQTLAHWIPITNRALADAGQVAAVINDLMRYGIDEKLHQQIVGGSGTAPQLRGIANTSGIQTQDYSTDLFETLLKARTKVRTVGRATPTAYGMHPTDFESILLQKDDENRYYYGGPSAYGITTVWGLPVFEDESFTTGTCYVADWKMGKLWVREDVQFATSESHSDFFIKNLTAMRFEMRAAFGVVRPKAFVEIDLTP